MLDKNIVLTVSIVCVLTQVLALKTCSLFRPLNQKADQVHWLVGSLVGSFNTGSRF